MTQKRKKVGLALGGGGARGCAHIGVIKALQEAGIPIDFVAGTSIGAVIGAGLASGDLEKFEEHLNTLTWKDTVGYFDPAIPSRGLFKGERVCKLLEKFLSHPYFEGLKIPLTVVATDLETSKEVRLSKGNLIQAIRASIAIPGIFTPCEIGNRYLIDGGVVNPLPVNVVWEMGADIVIAVDLNYEFIQEKLHSKRKKQEEKSLVYEWLTPERPNIFDVLENSLFILQSQVTEKNLQLYEPDILIRPKLGSASLFDFYRAKPMVEEGYWKMKKEIPKIKRMLKR